jgi:hypothetical protein
VDKWTSRSTRITAGALFASNDQMSVGERSLHVGPEKLPRITSTMPDLPKVANLVAQDIEQISVEEERNPIFDALVTNEGEIAGLVAYSIYKQNKRAWLGDFRKATGRPPTEDESRAYIIGESTQRRLAIYRHLAAATLAGEGLDATSLADAPRSGRMLGFYVAGAVVLLVAIVTVWFAMHLQAGMSIRTG